jgi:hypothetical protein
MAGGIVKDLAMARKQISGEFACGGIKGKEWLASAGIFAYF